MHEFHSTFYAQEVIFGAGAVSGVREAVDRFGWQRLLLCTSRSLRQNGHAGRIESALGELLVATFERVLPHVPEAQVAEALAQAGEQRVDALVALGGGSAIGLAKALSLALERPRTDTTARDPLPTDQPKVPVVAIPTTYAGSEMTPVYGVTRDEAGASRKVTVTDPKVAPKLIIYDPALTLDLAPAVTAATGINALAHCIEALYSVTRNPLSSAAAREGVRCIARALPRCYAVGDDLEARTEMLVGAYLAGTALATVAMGLHHGLCHVLGGTAGVAHGVANSIMLPHAMRFNLDATAPQLALAAQAMGITSDDPHAAAEEAIQRVYLLVGQLGLPQRLRDVGVAEADLPGLAQLALRSRAVQANPRPITDAAQVEAVLRAAW
jgi:maleylacetate reductase